MEFSVVQKLIFMISIALSALISPMTSYAIGSGFGYEFYGAYYHNEDESNLYDFDQFQTGISIFDREVGYGDYPYLLTNFFERRTHLDFSYSNSEFDATGEETSANVYGINYSFASVGTPVLFDFGASRLVGDGTDSFGAFDVDATIYYFGFGYYISSNSVASINLTAADYVISDDVIGEDDYDETHLQTTWQHVLKIGVENYISLLVDVEAIEIGASKNSNVGLVFDYYATRKVGFGISYTAHRGDYDVTEGATVALRASAFLDERFGIVAEIDRLFADTSGNDEDSFYLKGIVRFN